MKRNLVIVRAGDDSLHTQFLGDEAERSWDILVSCYGKNPDLYRDRGQERVDDPRLANPSLYDLIAERHQDWLKRYDHIWFCCDDIIATPEQVNRIFAMCREHRLELAQPALTLDSKIYHPITAVNKAFQLRYTSWVESMIPCFTTGFLVKCMPTYGMNQRGFGMDYLWPEWVENLSQIAILDAVPVTHTRAGGPLHDGFKREGVTPQDELRKLLQEKNVWPLQMVTGGIDLRGRLHVIWKGDHRALMQALMAGYLPEMANYPDLIYKAIEPIFQLLNDRDFTDVLSVKNKLRAYLNPPSATTAAP